MASIDNKFTIINSMKDQMKLDKERTETAIKCPKCGHTISMPYVDRTICTWCGIWVYKNDKAKFKYKLKEELNKKT